MFHPRQIPSPQLAVLAVLLTVLHPGLGQATSTDIEISPSNLDRTIFEEGNFRRACRYMGSEQVSELLILRDGAVIDGISNTTTIMLDVVQAQLTDAGSYTCQVLFSDSTSTDVGMGSLTVVDLELIIASPVQYVVAGEDISLQCSFHDPDNVYGIVITTIRQGTHTVGQITNASVEDEGHYECDVSLITHSASGLVPIVLHVFTPLTIEDKPDIHQTLMGVQPKTFSITFTGRQSQNIVTMWFHNGVILRDTTQHQLSTTFSDEMVTGTTSIQFPEMVRADSGVYRMVVSTDFGEEEIESSLRRKEVSFQVDLRVPPPDPANFHTVVVAEHHAELQWDLPITHPDEDVQSFQLELSFPNGTTASSMTLNSTARSTTVSVFPGVTYEAHLIARNGDGLGESRLTFSTPPSAPYVSAFESRRLNETHFNITISLLYTGGGDIITFSVYFREHNSIEWSAQPVMIVQLDSASALEYRGTISGEEIRGKGPLEFELRVENGLGFMNRTGSGLEISDPPGAPTTPKISETSDTSVILDVKLPEEGTPPFINVVLEFSEPQVMARNYSGLYTPGQTFTTKVSDLSPRTAYSLKARAVNYAGNGPSSETINFTTSETPPMTTPTPDIVSSMPWLLPAVGGGGGLIVVVVVIVISCCCFCCCYRRKKKGNNYTIGRKVTTTQHKDIESGNDHEMHQRTDTAHTSQSPHPTLGAFAPSNRPMAPDNSYVDVPGPREVPSSTASNSPSLNQRWRFEKGNNRLSSITLNSGGSATQQSQDSFGKKHDILSSGSDNQLMSLSPSSQQGLHSHRTSKDNIMASYYHKHKVVSPSISSAGSEATSTATTERRQQTPYLSSQAEETYSFQSSSMPFIPEGSSYSGGSSQAFSVVPQSQHYASDV